jgi:Kef-type K+ transport system membrane component KefB
MHPRILILLSFALGMSSVGIIYFISGQFWRKWLFKGAEHLTKRQSEVRAVGVIVFSAAIGIVSVLLPSLRH